VSIDGLQRQIAELRRTVELLGTRIEALEVQPRSGES
jgi:hypothetical protein